MFKNSNKTTYKYKIISSVEKTLMKIKVTVKASCTKTYLTKYI